MSDVPPVRRVLLLASGSGSNVERIAERFAERPTIEVVGVLSDRKQAGVHQRAARLGIKSEFVGKTRREAPGGMLAAIDAYTPDLIVLAGYLRLVPNDVLERYIGRVVNIHPALLPKYGGPGMYGQHVHAAVVAAGETVSGITIHLADLHYDEGKVLFQATVPLSPDDTPAQVAARVLSLEHRYYPPVVEALLDSLPGLP